MTANEHARRGFIDAVIGLSDSATPVNVLRYLRASATPERRDTPGPPPGQPDPAHDDA